MVPSGLGSSSNIFILSFLSFASAQPDTAKLPRRPRGRPGVPTRPSQAVLAWAVSYSYAAFPSSILRWIELTAFSSRRMSAPVHFEKSVPFGCHLRTNPLQSSTDPFSHEAQARVQWTLHPTTALVLSGPRSSRPLSVLTKRAVPRALRAAIPMGMVATPFPFRRLASSLLAGNCVTIDAAKKYSDFSAEI